MTVGSLFLTWALIAAVCAASCAIARWVGQRVDNAEKERSRRQWRLMCEELDLEDLPADHAYERATNSPSWPHPALPAGETTPTEAVR